MPLWFAVALECSFLVAKVMPLHAFRVRNSCVPARVGTELPDYPQGRPELVAVKYVIPPGQKLSWHHHVSMNHGVLVQGELKIIGQDGKTTVLHAGDVVVEMVDAVHHGESCGTEPVVLYMFYLSQGDLPLSVQHPDIPLE